MAAVEPKFKETQQYRSWVFWILVSVIFLAPFITRIYIILELGIWEAFGQGILIHILSIVLIILLFIFIRTKVSIDQAGVEVRYFPFAYKKFSWEEIKEAKMIKYNFKQLRGKGVSYWRHYGMVAKMKGNRGLLIKLKNKKNYLISTQKPDELKKTVENYTS